MFLKDNVNVRLYSQRTLPIKHVPQEDPSSSDKPKAMNMQEFEAKSKEANAVYVLVAKLKYDIQGRMHFAIQPLLKEFENLALEELPFIHFAFLICDFFIQSHVIELATLSDDFVQACIVTQVIHLLKRGIVP